MVTKENQQHLTALEIEQWNNAIDAYCKRVDRTKYGTAFSIGLQYVWIWFGEETG